MFKAVAPVLALNSSSMQAEPASSSADLAEGLSCSESSLIAWLLSSLESSSNPLTDDAPSAAKLPELSLSAVVLLLSLLLLPLLLLDSSSELPELVDVFSSSLI